MTSCKELAGIGDPWRWEDLLGGLGLQIRAVSLGVLCLVGFFQCSFLVTREELSSSVELSPETCKVKTQI
jgi:hypothetical protein